MKIPFFLILVSISSFSMASEQDKLAKWNTDVNKNIRQSHADKLAQTTYREINVKDARVSDDISKVYPQIETKVTKDGSATRVVAEAVLNTDKEKVAKDWAKKLNNAAKYGKGVLGGAALGLIVDQLLDAVDYVMGEGGQVLKKPTVTDPRDPKQSHYLQVTSAYNFKHLLGTEIHINDGSLCAGLTRKTNNASTTIKSASFVRDPVTSTYHCRAVYENGSSAYEVSFTRYSNPSYKPSAPEPERVPVTETELKDAIKSKVLDNPQKQNLAKDIVKDSYARIWDDKGNSLEIRGDVTNKQKDIVNSNDPTSDGHTTSTPSISDGKSGSGSSSSGSSSSGTSEGTTFNPDGSVASSSVTTTTTTSTSTTNIEFELPAFCDWASTVCDWLDWTTKDETQTVDDEIPEKELELPELDTTTFKATAGCPSDIEVPVNFGSQGVITISYMPICEMAERWSFVAPMIGFLAGALIIAGVGRKGEDQEV